MREVEPLVTISTLSQCLPSSLLGFALRISGPVDRLAGISKDPDYGAGREKLKRDVVLRFVRVLVLALSTLWGENCHGEARRSLLIAVIGIRAKRLRSHPPQQEHEPYVV